MRKSIMLRALFDHKSRTSLQGSIAILPLIAALTCLQTPPAAKAQSDSTGSRSTVALQRRPSSISIGAGDLIDVQVFNTPELSGKLRVSDDGTVNLPGAKAVKVIGLNPSETGTAIEKSLRDSQIMLDPHVTVLVTEYSTQGISVLGEVKKPGTYLLLGTHSLYEALAAAGGATDKEGATIQITHQGNPARTETVQVNSPNFSQQQMATTVQPGDIVVVSQADKIWVVGDVGHPGAYFIENGENLSILNAIALAQGLNPTAKMSKASIVRKTSTGAKTIPVNLKHIAQNNSENLALKSDDVLVIPRSDAKAFLNFALPGVTGAVAGAVATALVLR